MRLKRDREVQEIVERISEKMRRWGITVTFLAAQLSVSRQYAWQIVHYRTSLSRERAMEIERAVDTIIEQERHVKTFGDRLRAARISAGMTLKQVAEALGYTWVGVERWEKNHCLPKPGVLDRLLSLYGEQEHRSRHMHPLPIRVMLPAAHQHEVARTIVPRDH